jgi:hypothetical protein
MGIMKPLTPEQYEDLSAWLDGQLAPDQAEQVRRLCEQDPAWSAAQAEMKALDGLLDLYRPPTCPAGLAERIAREVPARVRPTRKTVLQFARWLVPLAAAAAVLVGVLLHEHFSAESGPATPGNGTRIATQNGTDGPDGSAGDVDRPDEPAPGEGPAVEEFVVQNLDFFQDYDVVSNFELLREIERLEAQDAPVGT